MVGYGSGHRNDRGCSSSRGSRQLATQDWSKLCYPQSVDTVNGNSNHAHVLCKESVVKVQSLLFEFNITGSSLIKIVGVMDARTEFGFSKSTY